MRQQRGWASAQPGFICQARRVPCMVPIGFQSCSNESTDLVAENYQHERSCRAGYRVCLFECVPPNAMVSVQALDVSGARRLIDMARSIFNFSSKYGVFQITAISFRPRQEIVDSCSCRPFGASRSFRSPNPRVCTRGLRDQTEREALKGRHELDALGFLSSLRD